MKKVTALLLFGALLICPSRGFAAETEDSLSISHSQRELLSENPDNTIIRIYEGDYRKAFREKASIEDIIQEPYTASTNYIVFSDESLTTKSPSNVVIKDDSQLYSVYIYSRDVAQQDDILSVLGEDVKAEKTYYLANIDRLSGLYIYYETNVGDFVYYCAYTREDAAEYLFPLDVFYVLQEDLEEFCSTHGWMTTTYLGLEEMLEYSDYPDLSKYELSTYNSHHPTPSKEQYPWVLPSICCVAVVILALVTFLAVHKNRQKRNQTIE